MNNPIKLNFKNRTLFQGNNIDFLRVLPDNCIDLIATDPPYNKNQDFHAKENSIAAGASYSDKWSWDEDIHPEWIEKIKYEWPKIWKSVMHANDVYSKDMGAFLCFLAIRMIEFKRILKEDGSIYLQCDHTASSYIKTLMDAVFGAKNFRNEIIWHYKGNAGSTKKWGTKHDTIFFYSKSNKFKFNIQYFPYTKEQEKRFKEIEEGTGRRYFWNSNTTAGRYKSYMKDGVKIEDVWIDIQNLTCGEEYIGYPTQKPLKLYERIIIASSNPGDWVLDPFGGCATTPVAAERLNRKWVSMDYWTSAIGVIAYRFHTKNIKMKGQTELMQDLLKNMKDKTHKFYKKVEKALKEPSLPGTEIGEINLITTPPEAIGRKSSLPPLFYAPNKTVREINEPKEHLKQRIISKYGSVCWGCETKFHERHLQVDHNHIPKSQGGRLIGSNAALLCGPCNMLKSNSLNIIGLRKELKRQGIINLSQKEILNVRKTVRDLTLEEIYQVQNLNKNSNQLQIIQ